MEDHDKTKEQLIGELRELRLLVTKLQSAVADFKETPAMLQDTEHRLELALKGADLTMWDVNIQTAQAVYWPDRLPTSGYSVDEMERNIVAFGKRVHPEDMNNIRKAFNAHAKGLAPLFECEYRLKDKDGNWRWILARGKIVERDDRGNPLRLTGTSHDITLRKHAELVIERELEKRLRQSEEKYHLIFNTSPVGMMHFDSDGIITDCNAMHLEILGASRDQVIGLNLFTSLRNEEVQHIIQAALTGKTGTYEGEYTSVVTGRTRFVRVIAAPLSIPGSDRLSGMLIEDDITERKLAEDALRVSEERFRLIAETITEVFWMADLETNETFYISPGYESVWGKSRESLFKAPKSFVDSIHEEDRERVIASLEAKKSGERFAIEYRIVRPDGSIRWIWDRGFPVQDQNGRTISYVGVAQDITDQIRAEQEREALRSQLIQSQKIQAIGSLATGIAHDFNNMLTIIMGYSSFLLSEKREGDPGYDQLQRIVNTSQTAADLVQRILVFARHANLKPVPLDLNREVIEVTQILSHTLSKVTELQTELDGNLALVNADKALMSQVVMKLAINANEAMPQGGRLTIQTENIVLDDEYCRTHIGVKPGQNVLLTVSDTGRGIDKGLIDRIFDPFFSTKSKDATKGTGLGLSVVQGIVAQHGGHITVESEIGKGTTFRVYLPAIEKEPVPAVVETQTEPPGGGNETILLVEDDEMVRELGEAILQRFGYTVLTAVDGVEALDVYTKEQEKISLVILDIVMPRMEGKECLEELLRINPQVKVIISSGLDPLGLVRDLVRLGAKEAVNKPFSMREMLETVRAVLDSD